MRERIVALRKACCCARFSLLILQQRAIERSGATAVSDDACCNPPSAQDCSDMCREYILSDHICMSAPISGRKLHCGDCQFIEAAIGRMRRCFKFAISEETIEQQYCPPDPVGPSLFDAFLVIASACSWPCSFGLYLRIHFYVYRGRDSRATSCSMTSSLGRTILRVGTMYVGIGCITHTTRQPPLNLSQTGVSTQALTDATRTFPMPIIRCLTQ